MAVYVFSLVVGYAPGGVDHAQGFRARLLKDFPNPIRYVFAELPARRDINLYRSIGIDTGKMISVHQQFTDNHTLKTLGRVEDKIRELQDVLHWTDVEYRDKEIRLIKNGWVAAEILLDAEEKDYFYGIHYFNYGNIIRTEIYTEGIAYANYYVTAKSDKGPYAKLVKRSFYNKDGSVVYEQIFEGKKECYLFPDGRLYTKQQLIGEFVKNLKLGEKDIVFIDRGTAQLDYAQVLFQVGEKAKFMVFLHGEHFYEKNQGIHWANVKLEWQYLYWFKYADKIDTMIVSTQEQKEGLADKLREYQCSVPNIVALPAGGIDQLRYPENGGRRICSILSVSRLDPQKKIDWLIKSVIKAHQINPDISIDIYGGCEGGCEGYAKYLEELISSSDASSYIRLMGYKDVKEIYKNYEVYLSASLYETLGISVMEAVASGTAVIGLDVRYGNRLFIHHEKNGYLIHYNQNCGGGDKLAEQVINEMSERVVAIFKDTERLKEFHQESYKIAREFLPETMERKWKTILG